MKVCKGYMWHLTWLNCCTCVQRALFMCKINYDGGWPNWPFNRDWPQGP
jgi:hypothetical protein